MYGIKIDDNVTEMAIVFEKFLKQRGGNIKIKYREAVVRECPSK